MDVHEILVEHRTLAFLSGNVVCACDRNWRSMASYRSHLAEVLDKHVQIRETQAQVNVLNGVASAWEEMASSGATHLYVLMLRETAKRIGADINGR